MNKKNFIFVVIGGAFIVALAFVGYRMLTKQSPTRAPIACTEEAFQCPDGSYVARSGSRCIFAPCPNQSSFTGILRQDIHGFTLIVPSPENGGDVAYAMPLTLKVSNVLGQLIGQKVKVYGTFTEGAMLAVDRVEELPGDAGDPTLGEVAVGKSIFINGVRITLNKIVQDSRCPVDVICIQAGSVTANITLKSDTDNETKDIVSGASPIAFDSYHISIENVKPSRISSAAPTTGNYLITFRVRLNSQ